MTLTALTIGSIFVGLALLILVVLFLIRPFFKPHTPEITISERAQLQAHKEALVYAIKGLEFDHDTGKLPDKEYEQQRNALMVEAANTLKALDELHGESAEEDIFAQIEAAVGELRQRRLALDIKPSHYCTNCGQGLESSDKFCARCGQPVLTAQPTT